MTNIQDTGVRGYLKWLQQDQPGLYLLAAPIIAQQVPEAFSDREQSMAMGGLMGLGDDSSDTDVANAANSGATSSSIAATIGNIVSALGQAYLAKTQVDTLAQVNQVQLQRAAAGLPPLNTSSLSLGVPQVQVGLTQSTTTAGGIALAAIVGLGLLFVLSGRGGGQTKPAAA